MTYVYLAVKQQEKIKYAYLYVTVVASLGFFCLVRYFSLYSKCLPLDLKSSSKYLYPKRMISFTFVYKKSTFCITLTHF